MKKLILLIAFAAVFQACTIYDYESEFDNRDRIVGRYDVEEYSQTFNEITYYSIRISKGGYGDKIYLRNFYGVDITVYGFLRFDRITIPYQVVNGYEIEGTGTVSGNELDLHYSVADLYSNSATDFCDTQAWLDF